MKSEEISIPSPEETALGQKEYKIIPPSEDRNLVIEEEEFRNHPETIIEWEIGDEINRENFTSFLIKSFGISRGTPVVQGLFFKWLERKFGFDIHQSIINFMDTGGWNSLNQEEQNKFSKAYHSVRGGHDRNLRILEGEAKMFQKEFENLKSYYEKELDDAYRQEHFNLEQIENITQFQEAVRYYFSLGREKMKELIK